MLALATSCFAIVQAVSADAAEFEADVVETNGAMVRSGRLAVKGDDTRFSYQRNGLPVVEITKPADGMKLILHPIQRTYMELKRSPADLGPAATATGGDPGKTNSDSAATADKATSDKPKAGGASGEKVPCALTPGFACERIGGEEHAGIATDVWTIGKPGAPAGLKLWWDKSRGIAVREEYRDGRVIQAVKQADTTYETLRVEQWERTYLLPSGQFMRTAMLFAPSLGAPVYEQQPDGTTRRLVNIEARAPDMSLFEIPKGYRKIAVGPPPPWSAMPPTAPDAGTPGGDAGARPEAGATPDAGSNNGASAPSQSPAKSGAGNGAGGKR